MMVYVFFLIFVTALDLLLIGVQPSVLESSFLLLSYFNIYQIRIKHFWFLWCRVEFQGK